MLRFTLVDYTTNKAGTVTVIDEPVGWDGVQMRLKRSKDWHGFLDYVDDSQGDFGLQFIGTGHAILKNAYETKGVEAYVEFLVEFQCSETDDYEPIYYGRCNFGRSYDEECGDYCFVEVGIETTSCIMTFKNRYEQKVDLDSLESFDPCTCSEPTTIAVGGGFFNGGATQLIVINDIPLGYEFSDFECLKAGDQFAITDSTSNNGTFTIVSVTVPGLFAEIIVEEALTTGVDASFTYTGCLAGRPRLESYNGLNKEIMLPSKTIRLTTQWLAKEDSAYEYNLEFPLPFGYRVAITPDWPNVISEIENTLAGLASYVDALPLGGGSGPSPDYGGFTDENPPDEMIFFTGSGAALQCSGAASLQLKFHYKITQLVDAFKIYVVKDVAFTPPYSGQTAGPNQWVWDLNDGAAGYDFDQTINFNLVAGETIWIWFDISAAASVGSETYSLLLSEGSFFQLILDTTCEDSPAKLYMVNEAFSRIAEAYTNGCLRVYSDYFGRTDAQPYPSERDGCGGLESITNGLKIRAKHDLVPMGDTYVRPKVTVSMRELFDAMNAIHNIGLCVEPDPNRLGKEIIRIEPIHYFYRDDLLMTCTNILKVKRSLFSSELFSIVKMGYQKWETENANGLNDPFGKREYRTTLTTIKNTYDRICQFIASDYAIEVTRRKYGGTTKDWKYDNDIFILCLKNDYLASGDDAVIEYVADHTIKIHGYTLTGSFYPGDQVETFSGPQAGIYDVTAVSIVGPDTILTVSQTVTNEVSADPLYNITHPLKEVETANVASSSNLLYPDSAYNLRITPARNAMRHFKSALMSYRNHLEGILKFTNGDGNYIAQIELFVVDACLNENTVCGSGSGSGDGDSGESQLLPEDTDITLDDFSCPDDHLPLFWPERVKFEYPVTWQQYKVIQANPYGLIGFQCGDGDIEAGYIDDFQLKPTGPNGGLATFILKPKIIR